MVSFYPHRMMEWLKLIMLHMFDLFRLHDLIYVEPSVPKTLGINGDLLTKSEATHELRETCNFKYGSATCCLAGVGCRNGKRRVVTGYTIFQQMQGNMFPFLAVWLTRGLTRETHPLMSPPCLLTFGLHVPSKITIPWTQQVPSICQSQELMPMQVVIEPGNISCKKTSRNCQQVGGIQRLVNVTLVM